MHEIQPGHGLVRHFRIHPHDFRVIERGDKSEVRARGRHIDVAARLVRFGFEREAVAVFLLQGIFAQIVDRLPQPLHRIVRPPARVGFRSLASAPEDKNLGAEFSAQIHGAHRFLYRVSAHTGLVGGKAAIAKNRIGE